jgi:hypothetical protein
MTIWSVTVNAQFVIPGPSEARSPESITTIRDYGFRTCRFAAIRNDEK